ncbi:glycerol-3-phosphate dehydrogenase/oxidase [Herbiconiux moechotypicola]|uniref:Glycerol-3-phosphate dehydrogenase n=1 Tax=Herbiconiux moechotypicola TaxID=637393 RepID=A0ABP5QB57_9MICO|nr:glycerol-3-phosphate dehydrogenase/oxidase [Herbiconiux moechotypicola]MCS5729149.1 glycerol-3-phosphate dehydrogenase/oxidase [Herbiconiux moechotypicola]
MALLTTDHAELDPVDVVVIGAGINGLAVAREAASRGLSVALFDRDDLGSRTSSISTRLVHGGLKYLERFQLKLVYESIHERNRLLEFAPHLVKHYPMLIPFSKSQSRPGWMLACGLILHDVLSFPKPKQLPYNRIVFRGGLRRRWPSLEEAGLRWGGLFHDSNVELTERLMVELAISVQQHGGAVFTHTPVTGLLRDGGRVSGVRFEDRDGRERELRASVVVNAAGPWVDAVLTFADDHKRRIGPTKGSHLVVDAFPGAPDTCIFFEAKDTRPMFILPWAGRYMLGTTDLPYDGDIEEIVTDDDEVDYLFEAVNGLIPQAGLTPDDVLWSYSGVRPLPYVGDVDDPASVTREHTFVQHEGADAGLVTIVGGKLTTHRALGEQMGSLLVKRLGRGDTSSPTKHEPLPGAPEGDWDAYRLAFIRSSPLGTAAATRLVDTYGAIAEQVQALAVADPALTAVVDRETGAIAAEVVHAIEAEGALTLDDVILRRTAIGVNGDVGLSAAPAVAEVCVSHAGWSRDYADEELARYSRSARRFRPRAARILPDTTK